VLPLTQTGRYCRQTGNVATQADLVVSTSATQVYSKMLPLRQTGGGHRCNTGVPDDAGTGADKDIVVGEGVASPGEGAARDGNGNDEATATGEGKATSTEGSAEEKPNGEGEAAAGEATESEATAAGEATEGDTIDGEATAGDTIDGEATAYVIVGTVESETRESNSPAD